MKLYDQLIYSALNPFMDFEKINTADDQSLNLHSMFISELKKNFESESVKDISFLQACELIVTSKARD